MNRLRSRALSRRTEEAPVDPMSSIGNLADAMLVLAVGIMLALILNWNVDISTPQVQQRVGEGYRLGFRRFLLPKSSMKTMNAADYPEAEFLPVGQLNEAVRLLRD